MVVRGPWTHKASAAIVAEGVNRLVLNQGLGFTEPSLHFLRDLPIRELVLVDRSIEDLDPIHSLGPTLEARSLSTAAGPELDLGKLPKLTRLGACWAQVSRTLPAGAAVRSLFLLAYKETNLRPLAGMTNLVDLAMKDRPRLATLEGLQALPALRTLGIYLASNLQDVSLIAERPMIDSLTLEKCRRISRLDSLQELRTLRQLNVSDCGDIETIAPLRGLSQLRHLLLYGSIRIVDDDLAPLLDLPALRELRMQGRRSYRPSVQEVQDAIAGD